MGEDHRQRVMPWVQPRLGRQSRQERHPVEDFLFEYYPIRPSQLLRWHPGLGVGLLGEGAAEFLSWRGYRRVGDAVAADPVAWPTHRREGVAWMENLLVQTAGRPGQFGCCGLHEWAMVYQSPGLRHAQWPLRVTNEEIERTLKSQPVVCTHYDAFRFFTDASRPLNRFQLSRESQPLMEQPGCLHANMDLYKWAAKLVPFVRSELVADCFELAREIRELDMRASPYDLSALGYRSVRIETREGRAEYETAQRDFARRAAPLRSELTDICRKILKLTVPEPPPVNFTSCDPAC
ncbi:MAG: hypothetical protein Fur0032_01320 [Terrimicrobiaceae bacterium]